MTSLENSSSVHSVRSVQAEDFDLSILGGGTGSTVAAWTFASEGKHVAVIDRKYIGGSCPNIACLSSKNIARALQNRRHCCDENSKGWSRAPDLP